MALIIHESAIFCSRLPFSDGAVIDTVLIALLKYLNVWTEELVSGSSLAALLSEEERGSFCSVACRVSRRKELNTLEKAAHLRHDSSQAVFCLSVCPGLQLPEPNWEICGRRASGLGAVSGGSAGG